MSPKISPKVATGPAPADESTLEAYQQTLLKLRRLSLQTTKDSATYPIVQTTYGQDQSQSNPQKSGSPHSKVALRRDGTYVSAESVSGLRGKEIKDEGSDEDESEEGETADAKEDRESNQGADSGDETEGEEDDDEDEEEYCTCRRPGYGNMVKCNNQSCRYEWFHASCVGITMKPTAPWFCKECRSRMKGKARKMDDDASRVSESRPTAISALSNRCRKGSSGIGGARIHWLVEEHSQQLSQEVTCKAADPLRRGIS